MKKSINLKEVSTNEFSPIVLKSFKFIEGEQGSEHSCRYICDYEIDLILESKGSIEIDDRVYVLNKGDIVFKRPYDYIKETMDYKCHTLVIDLLGNKGNKSEADGSIGYKQSLQPRYVNCFLDKIPARFHPSSIEKYQRLFGSVHDAYINATEASDFLMKINVMQILWNIYIDAKENIPLSPYYSTIKRMIEYIKNNLDRDINFKDLATLGNLSPNYLHKVFTIEMGMTPNDYIISMRIDKAKELLLETMLPIYEIAERCGFDNVHYFSYCFKKKLSISPSAFRKNH